MNDLRQEYYRLIRRFQKVDHAVQHHGTHKLTNVVDQLQNGCQHEGQSERAEHTLHQTGTTWNPKRSKPTSFPPSSPIPSKWSYEFALPGHRY